MNLMHQRSMILIKRIIRLLPQYMARQPTPSCNNLCNISDHKDYCTFKRLHTRQYRRIV